MNLSSQRKEDMMRASIKAGLTTQRLLNIFTEKGLVGVYDLGQQHMYEYLNDKNKKQGSEN